MERFGWGMVSFALFASLASACGSSETSATNGGAGSKANSGASGAANGGDTGDTSNAGGDNAQGGAGSVGSGPAGNSSMSDARAGETPNDSRDASVTPSDAAAGATSVGGCGLFPADDPWNQPIPANAAIDTGWTQKLVQNATKTALHPDFGSTFGIPYNVVPANQATLPISFDYASDSDPGPYPFPGAPAKIEGGTPTACNGDCHVLCVLQGACTLFEAWNCRFTTASSSWHCGSGAKFNLAKVSAGQRPKGWTSADAAGLAILPGLARYDEAVAGAIKHAIRFTYHCTQDGFVSPASHQAVPNDCPSNISMANLRSEYPPMGLRIRLRTTYSIASLPAQAKLVAQAMQTYGMILADNGSDFYFQGDPNPGWSDDQLNALKAIPGSQFEVIAPGAIER